MKRCIGCKYAEWVKTQIGRLHPSGDGKCQYQWKSPQLPASMFWIGRSAPTPSGGFISRKNELQAHCPYYQVEKGEK
jgi:hypothetical protein